MLLLAPFAALLSLHAASPAQGTPPKLRTLIVGGGPSPQFNQVAIESNVRYVTRLLPPEAPLRILFADGNAGSKNVLFTNPDNKPEYRAPQLTRLDGPSELAFVRQELIRLSSDPRADRKTPVLIYFTGHGSGNAVSNYTNNYYDLWNQEKLTVKDFADSIKSFSKATPIAIVMVECYSGAFGNLLFQDADPMAPLVDQQLCGFFASVPQRVAAGCTPEVNEANYRDFTSYFFAALTGTDRLGKPVSGADYNHDGKIGMSEAFVYALIHDDSIDTPVCTSDFFLRRYVTTPDAQVFQTPYAKIVDWATQAQRAGLEALSTAIGLTGDDRQAAAYEQFQKIDLRSEKDRDVHLIRFVRLSKSVVLAHQLKDLNDTDVKRRYAALVKSEAGNPFAP